ncbi:hypothetical protein CGCSCA1_v001334 [Colletotrichum siamense]|nr:hypothetical protein CGCSCA1_v001334 [Colletotrichum siamense]
METCREAVDTSISRAARGARGCWGSVCLGVTIAPFCKGKCQGSRRAQSVPPPNYWDVLVAEGAPPSAARWARSSLKLSSTVDHQVCTRSDELDVHLTG